MRNYRGLTKKTKRWVYGWYFEAGGNSYIVEYETPIAMGQLVGYECESPQDCLVDFVEVIPETVGQFTSLKDKNGKGKEIYKNDIISPDEGIKYLVYWDTEYGQWWGECIQNKTKQEVYTRPLCEILDKWYTEIIGDIHTTPDLLESEVKK